MSSWVSGTGGNTNASALTTGTVADARLPAAAQVANLIAAFAQRPASTEKTIYVGTGTGASDANDGLTPKLAKATIPAAITALGAVGGVVQMGYGVFTITAPLTIPSGVTLRGMGLHPTNGVPTRIDASGIGADVAINLNAVSEVALQDFYLTGRASGAWDEIRTYGYCRGISIERVTVNTSTTGCGVHLGLGGSVIRSSIQGVTVVGAGFGFEVDSACTSVAFSNCFANACTVAGYLISGTYCTLTACAADTNTLYGYLLQDAVSVALIGCGAESNGRSAFYLQNAQAVSLVSCRGVSNNTAAVAGAGSFLSINDASDFITAIGCVDTTPNGATVNSVSYVSGLPGLNIALVNCSWNKPVKPQVITRLAAGASQTQGAGLSVPHGAAPTTPVDGDVWTTTGGLFVRVNGVTKTVTLT